MEYNTFVPKYSVSRTFILFLCFQFLYQGKALFMTYDKPLNFSNSQLFHSDWTNRSGNMIIWGEFGPRINFKPSIRYKSYQKSNPCSFGKFLVGHDYCGIINMTPTWPCFNAGPTQCSGIGSPMRYFSRAVTSVFSRRHSTTHILLLSTEL